MTRQSSNSLDLVVFLPVRTVITLHRVLIDHLLGLTEG